MDYPYSSSLSISCKRLSYIARCHACHSITAINTVSASGGYNIADATRIDEAIVTRLLRSGRHNNTSNRHSHSNSSSYICSSLLTAVVVVFRDVNRWKDMETAFHLEFFHQEHRFHSVTSRGNALPPAKSVFVLFDS